MTIVVYITLAAAIGVLFGRGKEIGFWWTFFFSFFFGLVIGAGIAYSSSKSYNEEGKKSNSTSVILGSVLLFISLCCFLIVYNDISKLSSQILLFLSTGLFGSSIYLLYTKRRTLKGLDNEDFSKQIDGLIVLVITGVFLTLLESVKRSLYFPIDM